MTPMAEKIVALINERGGVTFAEIARDIEGFGGGEQGIFMDEFNIILWADMTPEAVAAINEVRQVVDCHPTAWWTYFADGAVLKYPLAKQARRYKDTRWLPVVFNPRPAPAQAR